MKYCFSLAESGHENLVIFISTEHFNLGKYPVSAAELVVWYKRLTKMQVTELYSK
jgi:hypothetical protein